MATLPRSFGYARILSSKPDLEFDLEQLPPEMIADGSIDDISLELEIMGAGSAIEIRTRALRDLATKMRSSFSAGDDAVRWLATMDHDLAVWCACVCVREALSLVPAGELRPLAAIQTIEASLQYTLEAGTLLKAMRSAHDAHLVLSEGASIAAYAASCAAFAAHSDRTNFVSQNAGFAVRYSAAANDRRKEVRFEIINRMLGVIVDALPGMPVRVR